MPDNLATLDEHNAEFVEDLTRFTEKLAAEAELKKRYRISKKGWEELGKNDALFDAVAERRIQRRRTGAMKRERAQALVESAPDTVAGIMNDPAVNPNGRIEAAKTLNKFATEESAQKANAGEKFIITINLGADRIERYEKNLKPNGNALPPSIEHEPPKLITADDHNGEPV